MNPETAGEPAVREPRTPDPATIEWTLAVVRRTVAQMQFDSARPPRMLRIEAGEVSVELAWLDGPGPATGSGPAVGPGTAPDAGTQTSEAGTAEETRDEVLVAPMVGVFYRAPQPGASPFVSEGDRVTPGQQVAIVEAMKLMIPVEADRTGRITAVLVPDGQPVEYGEPLFTLDPDA